MELHQALAALGMMTDAVMGLRQQVTSMQEHIEQQNERIATLEGLLPPEKASGKTEQRKPEAE